MGETHEGARLREFILLFRHFAARLWRDFFGTGEADASNSIATMLALLMSYGICLAVFLVLAFGFQLLHAGAAAKLEAVSSARDVLTASTLALAGAYFVFLWENLFPDRFDCHILLALPVSPLVVLSAKLAAILGFLAIFAVTMHSLCLVVLPMAAFSAGSHAVWAELPAHLVATAAACATAFFALAGVLAMLRRLLSATLFRWLKPGLQLATFVVFLGQMFFSPPIGQLTVPGTEDLSTFVLWWPSFWFVGLADFLSSGLLPHSAELAFRALAATSVSVAVGLLGILWAYPKAIRQAMEETDFAHGRSTRFLFSEFWLRPWLGDDPGAYAIGLYTLKVLLRDARSRAMFLLYAGLAMAYGLREIAQWATSPAGADRGAPYPALLPIPLVLIFFAMLAIRALCATPITLPASWVFRLVDWGDRRRIRKAVRGVMLAVVVFPMLVLTLAYHLWAWDSWLAFTHTVVVGLLALILMEWILRKVDTVPFTRPKAEHLGKLRVLFGIYTVLFATFTFFLGHIEFAMLNSPVAFVGFLVIGIPVWVVLHWQNERAPTHEVQEMGRAETLIVGLSLER